MNELGSSECPTVLNSLNKVAYFDTTTPVSETPRLSATKWSTVIGVIVGAEITVWQLKLCGGNAQWSQATRPWNHRSPCVRKLLGTYAAKK